MTLSFKRTGKLSKSATSGKFTISGKAGLNRVVFYGKTSRTKKLELGKYKLSVSAVASDGSKSRTRTKSFVLKK